MVMPIAGRLMRGSLKTLIKSRRDLGHALGSLSIPLEHQSAIRDHIQLVALSSFGVWARGGAQAQLVSPLQQLFEDIHHDD